MGGNQGKSSNQASNQSQPRSARNSLYPTLNIDLTSRTQQNWVARRDNPLYPTLNARNTPSTSLQSGNVYEHTETALPATPARQRETEDILARQRQLVMAEVSQLSENTQRSPAPLNYSAPVIRPNSVLLSNTTRLLPHHFNNNTIPSAPPSTDNPNNSTPINRVPNKVNKSIPSTANNSAPNKANNRRPNTANNSAPNKANNCRPNTANNSAPNKANNCKPNTTTRNNNRIRTQNTTGTETNCATCKKPFALNIYQCSDGHSSCHQCKEKNNNPRCFCGKAIGNMRNILLENYLEDNMTSCTNASDGCKVVLKRRDLENHRKWCIFRDVPCPIASMTQCRWKGKMSHFVTHFDSVHPDHRQVQVGKEITLSDIDNASHTVNLVDVGPFNFLAHTKVDKDAQKIFMVIQLIGTKKTASKWIYEVHIYDKNKPHRKYQYQDVCASNQLSVDSVFVRADCAAVPLSYAMTFTEYFDLTYKFYIKRAFNNNREANVQQ